MGKTAVGIALAQRLGGEIVSADSRQIYRYLTIGTAQPTPEERAAVPHHCVDFVEPNRVYTVAEFKADAERALDDILQRGKQPLVVGGTGLYIKALVDGLTFTQVAGDEALRRELEREAEEQGNAALHARLAAVDPETAVRLHVNDRKRIVRALEVYLLTGKPLSYWHTQAGREPPRYEFRQFGLAMPREALYARINDRVKKMLAVGWVDEVRNFLARGYDPASLAWESLGYRYLLAYLRGEVDLTTAIALTQRDTRRFAKRQLTWFRADRRIQWFNLLPNFDPAQVAERVLASDPFDKADWGG